MVTRSALEAARSRADAQAKGRRLDGLVRILGVALWPPRPLGCRSRWRARISFDLFVPNAVAA